MRRIIASYFGKHTHWIRLANTLTKTAQIHCPDWSIEVTSITPTPFKSALGGGAKDSFIANTQKMEHWWKQVMAAPEGDQILLIDADTAILHPLNSIWDLDFDVAYTTKPQPSPFPFNSGVVFLRVNERSKAFINTWYEENVRLLCNEKEHREWRRKFGGINQAALGSALSKSITSLAHIIHVPCTEWNCEDYSWKSFDPSTTKILHVKGRLRRAIFDRPKPPAELVSLTTLWKQLEPS